MAFLGGIVLEIQPGKTQFLAQRYNIYVCITTKTNCPHQSEGMREVSPVFSQEKRTWCKVSPFSVGLHHNALASCDVKQLW